ncbi:elongation factor P 5-aminopentanone reductase [Staphylococcus saprophyticus]|uniref:elongation factor P 5-aminopentanone reductase n=1 Tax=Staphylococcus saprophyticus TaxID=29385 RepID=UPI000E08049B|nr:SDR family oxidoreductase [Staphylococcus saprophyticus]MBN6091118.1 SDR family oxidoreductase [Staphylococcus saprophyticus]MEB7675617.1 SDR family oxidoreductase [Staphylococcus saprophyticus]SUM64227.1 short chain dehydrogenase [Staphylococcus saprophyticus]SUM75374.1 short chain dehydrogenase [Staphylococcus saprophyticus]SUM90725.1 short chain dehydrogenase [Staphylococcus saprophyticus]
MKALVMGGSGSIGTAIVDRLLSDGYEVIIQYNQANVDTLQSQYKSQPVQFIQIDLMQDIDFEDYFDFITNLDCLIYASGAALYGQIQDMTDEMIDLAYQIHVKQFIRVCRYFVDQLRQSQSGRIVVISSIWGETGASMESVYSAMKGAQIAFVKALSQELAMTSVTVNAIAPGLVSGNMARVWSEAELAVITEDLPQQRLIDPTEIAHTCSYLCHPFAKSITGTIQKVNGAWYL